MLRRWRWPEISLGHRSACLRGNILDAERKPFCHMIRRRARPSVDMLVVNRSQRRPWVTLLLSRIRHRIYKMDPCDTPVILYISLWESARSENWTIFSIIICVIMVGMIKNFIWDGNFIQNGLQLNVINTTHAPHSPWNYWWNQNSREVRLTGAGVMVGHTNLSLFVF